MRTLVCILCQVRHGELTWPKFKENVLDVLDADLALCISADSHIKAGGKVVGTASEDNGFFHNAKYIFRYNEPEDWGEAWDAMTEGRWREFVNIPGDWLGGVKKPVRHETSGAIGTFYRWFFVKNLKENNLLDKYDQFIITRSDYLWAQPHPKLDLDHVWVPNGEFHFGITDRHMVLPAKFVEEFLGIGGTLGPEHGNALVKYYSESPFFTRFGINLEGYLWFMYTYKGIHTKIGFFTQKMYVVGRDGTVRYPDEYEAVHNSKHELITWPWEIDHTFLSKNAMFVGKLKSR